MQSGTTPSKPASPRRFRPDVVSLTDWTILTVSTLDYQVQ